MFIQGLVVFLGVLVSMANTNRRRKIFLFSAVMLGAQLIIWTTYFYAPRNSAFGWPGFMMTDIPTLVVAMAGATFFVRWRLGIAITAAGFANATLILLADFALFYRDIGVSNNNFNIPLSRFDALYFAIGTFSTAGTGNITPVSELAKEVQAFQMMLDIALMVFIGGLLVARLYEVFSSDIKR